MGIPADLDAVLHRFRCCELATVAADGTPSPGRWSRCTGPRGSCSRPASASPAKAANIRRDPRVSLRFSDPTGSGLTDPPAVLVQGTATVDDGVQTWGEDLGAHRKRAMALQPISRHFSGSPPARWFMDWYYLRLVLRVTPRRICWWPAGDTFVAAHEEVLDA